MALKQGVTNIQGIDEYYAKRSSSVADASQKSAERTLGQKFASGVARVLRPAARTVLAPVALTEAAIDTVGGYLAGESREQIQKNVDDALTRGRSFGVLGGSNVRPVGISREGVGTTGDWAQDVKSFVGDVGLTGVQVGSLVAPTGLAARGAGLGKAMLVGAGAEGLASGVGEAATQIQEGGGIRPKEVLSSALFGGVVGAALPGLGRVVGSIFPSAALKAERATKAANGASKFNSDIANNAAKNTMVYRLTDKSPNDLKKVLGKIVSKNDEVTQLSARIADEEAALKALKETDMEANIRPALEEVRVARETMAVPMRERLLAVARENNPTKARTLVQGAIKNIDNALSTLKKSTSEYKKLSIARNALTDGAAYLMRESVELQRLGFKDLPDYADEVISILDSLPDSNAARLAAKKVKQAADSSRKAFKALEDANTKPQAFVKAAQDKLRAKASGKLAQQIAKKAEELETLKASKKSALDEVLALENTPEALYARELSQRFGSIDEFEKSFEIVKGLDGKKVSSFIVPKEAAEFFKENIKPITGWKNMFGAGIDTVRAWESLAKNAESLAFIRQNIIQPIMKAAGNYSKKVTLQTKKITDLAKEAGLDYDRFPLIGMRRRYLKSDAVKAVAAKRAQLRELLESGVEIEQMPQEMQSIARFIQDSFKDYYEMLNKNRRALGQPEIAFRKNYVTRSRAYSFLREIGYKGEDITDDVVDKWVIRRAEDMKKERAIMPYENMRKDSMDFEEDPIEAFLSYTQYAERDLEMNTLAAYLRPWVSMVGEATGSKATERFFNRWINEGVLGYASKIDNKVDAFSSTVNISKAISKFGNMYSNATLAGNIGSILSQFTTIPLIAAKGGRPFNTLKALGLALSSNSAWLRSQSKTLTKIDEAVQASDMAMARLLKQNEGLGGSAVSDFLARGMEYADAIATRTAFIEEYTAMAKAGVPHEQAVRMADDSAGKLNALYDRVFVPSVLRSKTVKALVPFQTFAFNFFNSLTRDAAVIGTTEDKAKAVIYLTKMFGTMMAVNAIYRHALGQEPFPITDDGQIQPLGALPVIGGIPKYGIPGTVKAVAVTPTQFLVALLSRDPEMLREAKKGLPNMFRLFGIPGTNQFFRTLEGVRIVGDGKIKSGNTIIPVEGTADILKTLIFGRWGSSSAKGYLDKLDENREEQFKEEFLGDDK